jgi:pSer/pThr/pTyr-binding forkhead associated (FHA) protein
VPLPITFHIYEGDRLVRAETLTQDVIKIGKLDSSHLRIDDPAVSRMHSVIEVGPSGEVHIIDLGSASGTIVNGQRVSKTRLQSGDQIQFGTMLVVIEIGQQAARAPTPTVAGERRAAPVSHPVAAPTATAGSTASQRSPVAGTGGFAQPGAFAQAGASAQPSARAGYTHQQASPASASAARARAVPATGLAAEAAADYGEPVTYQVVPVTPPVNPSEIDSADSAVEVIIMWGELSILDVQHLSPPRAFYVGDETDAKGKPATDFLIPSESIGASRLPIVVDSGSGVAMVLPQGATGDVTLDNQRVTFADLEAQGQLQPCNLLSGAAQYQVPNGATARVHHRGFTFIVKPTVAARPVGIGGNSRFDWRDYLWAAVSMAIHIGMLLLFYFLPPSSSSLSLDLLNADSRLVQYLIEPPETEELETPDWLPDSKMDDEGGKGKRHKDEEGQMGKKEEKKNKNKFGIEGPKDNEDPHMAREEAKEMASQAGIIGVLKASVGAWNSPTSPYGRDTALGNDPMSALGALMGDQIGANFGFGGLGLRGTGKGGGGTGEGTIGLGNIGTIGHGAGGGEGSGYGRGAGGFRGRQAKVPFIRSGKADVRGSLSKEVIRRIIHRHINEVRFCYEQELNQRPDLQGRVAVKFIISPTGAVQTAATSASTLGNAKAEACIVAAVRRWTFPSPEGGGIVVVNYPFVLEQTGG